MRLSGLLLLAALLLQGCPLEGKSCTEIGCADGARLGLRAPGPWPDGEYTFAFATPDTTYACELQLPEELPPMGSLRELSCSPRLSADLSPEAVCTETRSPGATSQSCKPVPGHFVLNVHFEGTPASLSVQVQRDGATLLDETKALRYVAERPNGPDCEPECRQTSLELTLP